MGPAARIASRARAAALLVVGSLLLHELRYLLEFGADAPSILAEHGHGYLGVLAPPLVAVAVAAIVTSLLGPALLRRLPDAERVCTSERAAAYAAGLLAVFFAQELSEGLVFAGHPAGLEGALGAGGWLALPLAMGLGGLAALTARWLDRAELIVFGLVRASRPRPPRRLRSTVRTSVRALRRLDLRFGVSGRAPPATPIVPA